MDLGADVDQQVGEERGAAAEPLAQLLVQWIGRRLVGRPARAEQRDVVAEVERDTPRAPERAGAEPHDLTGGTELVHPGR